MLLLCTPSLPFGYNLLFMMPRHMTRLFPFHSCEAKGIGALCAVCECTYVCNICFHFVWYLQLSSKEAVQRVLKGEKPSETLGKEKKKRSVVM